MLSNWKITDFRYCTFFSLFIILQRNMQNANQVTDKRNILTLSMLAASLVAAADNICGHVVDAANNDAVPYATVTITDEHNRKHTTVSDISGNFMFHGVGSGR